MSALSLVPCTVRDRGKDRTVRITASAVSLDVAGPEAPSQFLQRHFGFTEAVSAGGFASRIRPGAGCTPGWDPRATVVSLARPGAGRR